MVIGRTVREHAEATGLSVRVLRHWDERGVVSPSRTPAGHRLYDADDVVRLHRAITLPRRAPPTPTAGAPTSPTASCGGPSPRWSPGSASPPSRPA